MRLTHAFVGGFLSFLTVTVPADDRLVCGHVGGSYDTVGDLPDYTGVQIQNPDERLLGYGLYHYGAGTYNISWFSQAQPSAPAQAFFEQAFRLGEQVAAAERVDCLLIGLTGEFFHDPPHVTAVVSQLASDALSFGVRFVIAIGYPPMTAFSPEVFVHYSSIIPLGDYEQAKAVYRQKVSSIPGVYFIEPWTDMQVRSDGFHPDWTSAKRAALRVSEMVREIDALKK